MADNCNVSKLAWSTFFGVNVKMLHSHEESSLELNTALLFL